MRVQVVNQDPNERRFRESAEDMAMANELVNSPAWQWYVGKCEGKARALERALTDVNAMHDQRKEDRLRGSIDAFRRMPQLVNQVAARHARLQEKQQQEQQQ